MSIPTHADACKLEVVTEPIELKIGVTPDNSKHGPRPDLEGVRCKFTNRPHVYVIMDGGYRRHVQDATTYNNLFRSWANIVEDNDIDEITETQKIKSGSVLVRGDQTPHVYLVDHGCKRHIVSPGVMNKYHFNWDRIYEIPQATVDSIPDGQPIT